MTAENRVGSITVDRMMARFAEDFSLMESRAAETGRLNMHRIGGIVPAGGEDADAAAQDAARKVHQALMGAGTDAELATQLVAYRFKVALGTGALEGIQTVRAQWGPAASSAVAQEAHQNLDAWVARAQDDILKARREMHQFLLHDVTEVPSESREQGWLIKALVRFDTALARMASTRKTDGALARGQHHGAENFR